MGKPTGPITLEALIMDRESRSQARMIARIQYTKKHKAKVKPLAPVIPYSKRKGEEREREWIGENIESKNLYKGSVYSDSYIRKQGFKLPKLPPKKERKDG